MPEDIDCFRVDVEADGSTTTVRVHGELDLASAPTLIGRLDEVVARRPAVVVVDVAEVPFVDSAGIAAVLRAYRQLKAQGGELRLGPLSPVAERIFDVAGLLDQLPRTGNGATEG